MTIKILKLLTIIFIVNFFIFSYVFGEVNLFEWEWWVKIYFIILNILSFLYVKPIDNN